MMTSWMLISLMLGNLVSTIKLLLEDENSLMIKTQKTIMQMMSLIHVIGQSFHCWKFASYTLLRTKLTMESSFLRNKLLTLMRSEIQISIWVINYALGIIL